ncbi:pleckstrin homology domain-containing family A member 6 isoform X1 [Seriola lalandi dorsalis]|uniref:pleckstrin homology domain-containing family A member 6 isoform X1 n=1 Tax=Seriola lalandi dorsalis TaxID=1841481 RepID=UPI000C6FC55E|nr:pleckstrin homology domain-containing family A member 6 isoform X1 [Seriola lalandi dorsalis]XP_023280547.1 pleckstrin homology domain-containing family A member 6 isoform X1 [Seriola lalandi dorsalis]
MNVKVNTASERIRHCKNNNMVSDLYPEAQPCTRVSRTPKKAATFGKRSNSMRRNPKAEVTKQGWLYKQASTGVKQWNKRWFVLTDRCLFYYKDEKEDLVLGSLPLLSFRIGGLEPSDNVTRKFAFKVWLEEEEEEHEEGELKGAVVFCMQAEHAGTRTYYFSTDSHEEQGEWITAMSEAAEVNVQSTQRTSSDTTADLNHTMVTNAPDQQQHPHTQTHNKTQSEPPTHSKVNGVNSLETPPCSMPRSDVEGKKNDRRLGEGEDEGGGPGPDPALYLNHHPNGWANYGPTNVLLHNSNSKQPPSRSHSGHRATQGHPEGDSGQVQDPREQQENVVLRRGFVPRTAPERVAQRKSSMAQLQQWVNQRRGMASQEDINSPSRYYAVNRGIPVDYYAYPGGPQYVEEYPLYPPGVRPDSICSVSAVGGYDRRWTAEEKRLSLRDGPHQLYGPPMPRDPWGPQYYSGMETSMRRLSIQPRSRSVPRSPSSSSGGPYSPVPPNFASPARSLSARFDRFPGRMRDNMIYADPSVYSLRRSLSSPKYDYPGDRRSLSQGLYHHNYPVSPSIHSKMEDILDLQLQRNLDYLDQQGPPFHDVYSSELHPTLKLNEIETSKLLGRLCEQNQILKDHEAVVHRLRMDKDSLEEALVATHQEMELYHNQPLAMEKLQFKKETLQNQLINIRGELSQASSALTTTRMEFEALEDEANAIHGDLWEQLNAGGQSELVRRHIQKEFWRVQDVLEGLHKNNSSRGTDTAKHRVASGASGSFSTNSPASPLSSVSLTSPLSPFSPVPGSQASPTKQLGPEESVPPRPPLPKAYYPLEPSPATPPCIPPLPFDSTVWLRGLGLDDGYLDGEDPHVRKLKSGEQNISEMQDQVQDRQSSMNKVGIVPPRTKSPTDEPHSSSIRVSRHNGRVPNGLSRERPKSAVFPAEMKSKMSVEEQNERIRRNQSSSVRDKRRSLNLSGGHSPANYKVVRRRLTAHEIDIKDLEAAVRGQGQESPREEIARLRRLQVEPDQYDLDVSRELMAPEKVLIPERYLDVEDNIPLSSEEQMEKQKKLERIKTLIAKSNLQNMVPVLDGPVEGGAPVSSQQQLQEQEKRIEISCALAAEASRRSRILSAQCAPSPPTSPTSLAPPPSSADFPNSAHIMKV